MTGSRKLMLVAGARPNFMKIAPVIRELRQRPDRFSYALVHTGQHYDEGMSDIFFRELGIPAPHYHLNVGSGTHARQTAAIMVAFEPVLQEYSPDCVLVFGDVNSTLACSVVAKKLGYPVAHVEAGLRSGDWRMPEEVNRIVTDAIADFYFVTEDSGVEHLRAEGKPDARVFHVGHVMIDNLLYEVAKLDSGEIATPQSDDFKRKHPRYGVVTMHRPSNVDQPETLRGIIGALAEVGAQLPLIFPAHPRTRARIEEFGLQIPPAIEMVEPMGYQEFLNLWRDATLVLTDSGGMQEETTGLGIPCLTLRENTERPITVTHGTNRVIGTDPRTIIDAAVRVLAAGRGTGVTRPALWDGRASGRILDILDRELQAAP